MPNALSLGRRPNRRTVLAGLAASAGSLLGPRSLLAALAPDWTTPLLPFRIAGPLYYVGSRDLASYLLTANEGHVLINSNLATSPAQIRAAIERLGFRYRDVRILLISHAHYDHCAGSRQIRQETGAKYMVMDADVADIESGGKANFRYGREPDMLYPPAKVDHILHDGDQFRFGETLLTAHKTAGHTQGCTTWSLALREGGKTLNAVIVGSPNVLSSYNLIDDPRYPTMAADFAEGFRTLEALPCDLFLGAHGGYFDMLGKLTRQKSGHGNPFVDPVGYRAYIAERERAFEAEFARQKSQRK